MFCNTPIAFLTVPAKLYTASDLLYASTWKHVAYNAMRGVRHGVVLFLIIYLIERCYKVRTSKYKSRNFFHDICYLIYGRSDLPRILFIASLFAYLSSHLAFLEIKSFQSLPALVRVPIIFICGDFASYWAHRWQHSSRILWAFHSVHHSQEKLTFATSVRVHPLDYFAFTTLGFIPILILGGPFNRVLPIYLAMEFLIALQHCEIPWRFGALYPVVVSPTFHSIHHSISPEHHNRNFGRLLSIWDYLFGTAACDQTRPGIYGLQDWKMPTLLSQLCSPFTYLYRNILKSNRARRSGQELTARSPN
jgi:sterol desaturase/sphingolipid hydroxylase (fatty acid hydroxylase superfamily)